MSDKDFVQTSPLPRQNLTFDAHAEHLRQRFFSALRSRYTYDSSLTQINICLCIG